MLFKRRFIRPLTLMALACTASASHATLTYYSTQTSFAAAASGTSVDTFSDLGIFYNTAPTKVNRTVGFNSYKISAPSSASNSGKTNMKIVRSAADPAVSTGLYGVPLVIDSFSSSDPNRPVQAIGGNFFNVGGSANTYLSGNVTLMALDSDGNSLTETVRPSINSRTGAITSFEGFVTTATLVSLTVTPFSTNSQAGYGAAVDNLTLGSRAVPVAAVPEPQTWALALAGVGTVGSLARRSRSRQTARDQAKRNRT